MTKERGGVGEVGERENNYKFVINNCVDAERLATGYCVAGFPLPLWEATSCLMRVLPTASCLPKILLTEFDKNNT